MTATATGSRITTNHYEDLGLYKNVDLVQIINFPKIELGNWPTPLMDYQQYDNFAIKRDDLSGYGRGGIKTRKLEAILAYIKNNKVKNLITLVPNISNLRADLEQYTSSIPNDFSLDLLISNVPVLKADERKAVLQKAYEKYTIVGSSGFLIMMKMISKWFSSKVRTMVILPSLMHPTSVMGAANGLIELFVQCKLAGKAIPKHIFISACTGSSAAGLILSSEILRQAGLADIKINTVKVFPGALKLWIWFALRWTKFIFNLRTKVPSSSIIIHDSSAEVPYGESDASLIATCRQVKRDFDINIDPIYGARAWNTMIQFLDGKYKGNSIVYWHCGYTPDWDITTKISEQKLVDVY
jgi:1-aminocyclopropane-1-carboxylate deaminase/D-cysteine desulfhydrase-like pyridoxal-dependent ACC family enzyme